MDRYRLDWRAHLVIDRHKTIDGTPGAHDVSDFAKRGVRAGESRCGYGSRLFQRLSKGRTAPLRGKCNTMHRWKRRWHFATFAARGLPSMQKTFSTNYFPIATIKAGPRFARSLPP